MKLPGAVFSLLGPVPLETGTGLVIMQEGGTKKTPVVGYWDAHQRRIMLDPSGVPVRTASILGHEIAHMVMTDSGLANLLDADADEDAPSSDLHEAVCDAFGSWLAGAIMSGWLVLKEPKS